jgi:hypothetical protein
MSQSTETHNKAIVLEAFDTLFNKRDYIAASGFWSPDYVQHRAHIEPGRLQKCRRILDRVATRDGHMGPLASRTRPPAFPVCATRAPVFPESSGCGDVPVRPASTLKSATSRRGGAPNMRAYSRLN